jgi:hypothetical protein
MKNKQITLEQINGVLQAIYTTNISAQNFDAIKKMFIELPDIKETKNETKTETKLDTVDKGAETKTE